MRHVASGTRPATHNMCMYVYAEWCATYWSIDLCWHLATYLGSWCIHSWSWHSLARIEGILVHRCRPHSPTAHLLGETKLSVGICLFVGFPFGFPNLHLCFIPQGMARTERSMSPPRETPARKPWGSDVCCNLLSGAKAIIGSSQVVGLSIYYMLICKCF